MPPARDDKRLLVFTGLFVLLAGLLFAGVIFFATSRGNETGPKKPLYLGTAQQKHKEIRDGGPEYVANPFGFAGFWLDDVDGTLVAYVLTKPGTTGCHVKWKGQQETYVDCDGNPIDANDLDRYPVIVGSRDGSPKGSVFVDIRTVVPGPGSTGGDAAG